MKKHMNFLRIILAVIMIALFAASAFSCADQPSDKASPKDKNNKKNEKVTDNDNAESVEKWLESNLDKIPEKKETESETDTDAVTEEAEPYTETEQLESQPEETFPPETTVPPETAPQQPKAPDPLPASGNVIDNCVFVGDSICSGLSVYGVLPARQVVAKECVGIRSIGNYTFDVDGGSYYVWDALSYLQPKYVIFWMGMNDMNGTTAQSFYNAYIPLLDRAQSLLPSSKICVVSVTPVSATATYTTNAHIDEYNSYVKSQLNACGKYTFIDASAQFKDANGCLMDAYDAGDGLHIMPQAYNALLGYISSVLH